MESRTLSPRGLVVFAIGLGCMSMSHAYGPADDDESLATLNRARSSPAVRSGAVSLGAPLTSIASPKPICCAAIHALWV
jgi:hypothetical protein